MQLVALILSIALEVLFWAMWIRFFVDLTRSVNPNWRPRGLVLMLAETALTLTDPMIKFVRRIVPTIRLGAVALDFGWTIVLIAIVIAQNLVHQLH